MTRRDDSGLIDLNALLKDMAPSAPPPNETPQRHEGVCDPLATVPGDLYLLTMRLSAADSAQAPAPERERVAGTLLPAPREGRTRLAITVALVAVLACGGTAIGLTQGGAATSPPPPAHERAVAPALVVAERPPCDPSAMPDGRPAPTEASTSSRAEAPTLARPHRAAVSKTKAGELAKPAVNAPSEAPSATTKEVDPSAAAAAAAPASPSTNEVGPSAAAAAAAPPSPPTEAAATAEASGPAAPPRGEEPMSLDDAMRTAVMGKNVRPSAGRQDGARGSEGNATSDVPQ